MKAIHITQAAADLEGLLRETAQRHEPLQIHGGAASGVLIGEAQWQEIQAKLRLIGPTVPDLDNPGRRWVDEWDDGAD